MGVPLHILLSPVLKNPTHFILQVAVLLCYLPFVSISFHLASAIRSLNMYCCINVYQSKTDDTPTIKFVAFIAKMQKFQNQSY
jgi:hypothetical protein